MLTRRKIISRIVRVLAQLWTVLGLTLLLLFVLELTADMGYAFSDRGANERQLALRLGSDIYREQAWARKFWRESTDTIWFTQSDWHAYLYWRHRPYRGQFLKVDANGIRQTWNKSPSPLPTQVKVFAFGGSALWGSGARDEFTIPSLVSKKLSEQGREVWVRNFGEEGFVSTQEVIALMLELQKGNVPDAVIFYDGANDVFSAFQQGVAGIPQNEFNRVMEFNQFNWRGGWLEKSGLYRLAQTLGGRPARAARTEAEDLALANAVLDAYLANMQIVEALAQEYGFRVAIIWQPVIYDKKNLSEWEKLQLDTYGEARFFAQANRLLKERALAQPHPSFHDLSDAFGDQAETVFLDLFHISEAGNARIADLILQTGVVR